MRTSLALMEFINDLSTDSVFELIKQYYRDEQGKEIQIGSDEFAMASMMAHGCFEKDKDHD